MNEQKSLLNFREREPAVLSIQIQKWLDSTIWNLPPWARLVELQLRITELAKKTHMVGPEQEQNSYYLSDFEVEMNRVDRLRLGGLEGCRRDLRTFGWLIRANSPAYVMTQLLGLRVIRLTDIPNQPFLGSITQYEHIN
jgi:hypothetical protein